jgi:Flp pilus assembly protein TadD
MGFFGCFKQRCAIRKSDRLARQGRSEEALRVVEEALSGQRSVDLLIQRIWLLTDQGKYADALPAADEALREHPNHSVLHMLRGEILLKSGQADGAREALLKALALSGENIRVEYLLGLSYVALGDLDKASHYFDSSVRYDKRLVQSRLLAMAERYLFLSQKPSDRV